MCNRNSDLPFLPRKTVLDLSTIQLEHDAEFGAGAGVVHVLVKVLSRRELHMAWYFADMRDLKQGILTQIMPSALWKTKHGVNGKQRKR